MDAFCRIRRGRTSVNIFRGTGVSALRDAQSHERKDAGGPKGAEEARYALQDQSRRGFAARPRKHLITPLLCVPVVALNEFGQHFDYVVGNFRAEAFFAEPIDLIRKLLLSGAIMFIKPGPYD